jgi:hypothetical protein
MKKKTEISEVWKLIMARMVAQILVKVIDDVWEEKFDNPKDYWDNRIEIIDQALGERIERGEKID